MAKAIKKVVGIDEIEAPEATATDNLANIVADVDVANTAEVSDVVKVVAVDPVEIAFQTIPAQDGRPAFPL
jgi:hypothetical protein